MMGSVCCLGAVPCRAVLLLSCERLGLRRSWHGKLKGNSKLQVCIPGIRHIERLTKRRRDILLTFGQRTRPVDPCCLVFVISPCALMTALTGRTACLWVLGGWRACVTRGTQNHRCNSISLWNVGMEQWWLKEGTTRR